MDPTILLIALAIVALVLGMVAASNSRQSDSSRRRRADIEPQEEETQILSSIRQDEKIEAIKRVRETYSVGLNEAKDLVEAMEAGRPLTLPMPKPALQPIDDTAIIALVREHKLIEAIKLVREQNPEVGLKEAKDYVDHLQSRLGD